jgi:hypothetical protein
MRRRAAEKREILPDPKYGDVVLAKFMNCLMEEGKKSVAERIVYYAFDRMQRRAVGCGEQSWCRIQEAGRHAEDGRSQSRLFALSLVTQSFLRVRRYGPRNPHRTLP